MDNQELIARIDALERRIAERERQQITFPLDEQSIKVLQKYFMRLFGEVNTVGGVGGNTFTEYIGRQDNIEFTVFKNGYVPYTADATADTITVTNARFENDRLVYVATEDTAPAGLTAGNTYYVISATSDGTVFQLSDTLGGSAVNITSTGTGRQYILYLQ